MVSDRGTVQAKEKNKRNRPDHDGIHRLAFDRAKKRILASESICAICGLPVDKTLKYPDPMSPSIDHIIPIDRGGHPSDISNLQLAHWKCNRMKANKLIYSPGKVKQNTEDITDNSNRVLPLSMDWSSYKSAEQ
jgi:5-methylcytosine-specific restriction endonuclease McrA